MHKKPWSWILILLAAVILIVIIWLAATGGKETSQPPDPHAGHGTQEPAGQPAQGQDEQDGSALTEYQRQQDEIMADMMEGMAQVEPSGNAAVDFLAGMLPHHESAVAMSESYLQFEGGDAELTALAQRIIEAQTGEITQMQTMLAEKKAAGVKDEAREAAYLEAYDAMMGHHMSHTAASSVDEAFAQGMIMHHQMAVDMANAILPNTDDADVKELAQAIVDDQKEEIAEMQAILERLQET